MPDGRAFASKASFPNDARQRLRLFYSLRSQLDIRFAQKPEGEHRNHHLTANDD
jgi:hypothetical protein